MLHPDTGFSLSCFSCLFCTSGNRSNVASPVVSYRAPRCNMIGCAVLHRAQRCATLTCVIGCAVLHRAQRCAMRTCARCATGRVSLTALSSSTVPTPPSVSRPPTSGGRTTGGCCRGSLPGPLRGRRASRPLVGGRRASRLPVKGRRAPRPPVEWRGVCRQGRSRFAST